jgi:hypothetical protein
LIVCESEPRGGGWHKAQASAQVVWRRGTSTSEHKRRRAA